MPDPNHPLRILFYKRELMWPFQSGHDVHTFHLMKGLTEAGHDVSLVTVRAVDAELRRRLPLSACELMNDHTHPGVPVQLTGTQERFRSYWGVPPAHIARVRDLARASSVHAVVVSGLEVLPLLCGVGNAVRVWYAADEWLLHHLSQVRLTDRRSWGNARDGILKAVYERAFRSCVDRAWAVTSADSTALRLVAGIRSVDIIPNGVDAEHYAPSGDVERPHSAVFWGRLDFGPNIQALEWFCQRVWPQLRARVPDAEFTIIGFKVTEPVAALARLPGVRLLPDLPDVRQEVGRHAVGLMPFFSGGGIKNKLLEGAAMGKALVCSSDALRGLKGRVPFLPYDRPAQWVEAIYSLWMDDQQRNALGRAARAWVVKEHTWPETARIAADGIRASLK